jgi:hypothetical protein
MSTSLVPSNTSQLATLQHKFEELDAFAAQNSVTSLIGNGDVGAFTLTLRVSSAMQQLRDMITPEMMKPIMALQGSSLGFRTDKDKEGGYKEEVVKEVLIEATLKGFRMTQNETNIIGGRFYAARDGFERIFRDLGKQGRLTNLRLAPGIPKTTGDGAIVDYSASWTFKNSANELINDELKLAIPIRVNSGQGPDAVLGKAKRKMLAAIYSRITGTEITDGEVDDPRTLDVSVTPVKQEPKAKLSDEMIADLEKILKPHEDAANKYLLGIGWIATGETFRNISEKNARSILAKKDGFLSAAGIKG